MMNKETYMNELESIKKEIIRLNQHRNSVRETYIQANKPCEVGDIVMITLFSGRIVTVEAKAFGILEDDNVYVTAFWEGSTLKYITKPYLSLKVL